MLDEIQGRLLAEADQACAAAERYQHSKKAGEKNSVPIYVDRASAALGAWQHLQANTWPLYPTR